MAELAEYDYESFKETETGLKAYIQAPLTAIIIFLYFFRSQKAYNNFKSFLIYYFSFSYLVVTILIATDFGYFSFFNEHITLMIYGILDDDTKALWATMKSNYNITLIFSLAIIYSFIVVYTLKYLLKKELQLKIIILKKYLHIPFLILILVLNIFFIRGTFAMFPLIKEIPPISTNIFINELPNNGILAFINATKLYTKSKSGDYNLIKSTNYTGKLNEAFSFLTQKNVKKNSDYIKSITYNVPKNKKIEQLKPHVIVIMVESFGLPITKYQSKRFNILGRLKKHFDEDTLFTNFISAGNGTIVSLEPMLLNITARPSSTSIAQSKYQYTPFVQAAARVYEKAGYETRFVYGGNLDWRNIGKFIAKQGFKHQDGKISIINSLGLDSKKSSHDWGVFDQYAYDYIINILKNSKKPQFIFLLTTNNHPPFKIPKEYISNSLIAPPELVDSMIGDKTLIQKRLFDYQYALDMAGRFMDKIKSSNLANKSVVAITADNNTIEGRIRYKNQIETTKKIPFYLYAPKSIKKQNIDTTTPASHKDLFATLYHQTLSDINYISVGKNLFDKKIRHCGFNDMGIIISKTGAFLHHKAKDKTQEECDKEYDSALAISDWLIRINSTKIK
jgi:phosphoglycerol transferase MdoB-like AlkP superfamily enzyme